MFQPATLTLLVRKQRLLLTAVKNSMEKTPNMIGPIIDRVDIVFCTKNTFIGPSHNTRHNFSSLTRELLPS